MRSEENCERRDVVRVPVVVEPVAVPVPLAAIPVEVQRIPVTVRVPQLCARQLPHHHPSKACTDLQAESYLASQMPYCRAPSIFIFEVSVHDALHATVIAYILIVQILDSVAGNRNRPHMHLLPCVSISKALHLPKKVQGKGLRDKGLAPSPSALSANLRAQRRSPRPGRSRARSSSSPTGRQAS